MQFHNYLIAIGLFSLVVVAMLSATVNIKDNYADLGVTIAIDENQSAAFDKIADIDTKAEDIEKSITGTDVGGEDADVTFLGGAWSAIQMVFSGLGTSAALVGEVVSLFHIPSIFQGFFITAIILTVIFTGIYMVFKYKGE